MRTILCAALAIDMAGTFALAQTRATTPPAGATPTAQRNQPGSVAGDEFIIGPQDVLDISVWCVC